MHMLEQSGEVCKISTQNYFALQPLAPEGEAELTRVLRFTLVIYFGWQTDKLRWARSTQGTGRERRGNKGEVWGGSLADRRRMFVRRACLPTETETFRPHISGVWSLQRRRRRWPEFKPLQTSTVSLPPPQTPS